MYSEKIRNEILFFEYIFDNPLLLYMFICGQFWDIVLLFSPRVFNNYFYMLFMYNSSNYVQITLKASTSQYVNIIDLNINHIYVIICLFIGTLIIQFVHILFIFRRLYVSSLLKSPSHTINQIPISMFNAQNTLSAETAIIS